MTARVRLLIAAAVGVAVVALLAVVFQDGPAAPDGGGQLVATLRGEPTTFNRYVENAFPTHLISLLTQAPLVRINRVTQQVEPYLASSWTVSDDGRRWTLDLRTDVTWSDGTPFTVEDVLFSFRAAEDVPESKLKGVLEIPGGGSATASAEGTHRLVLDFPTPYGPGVRLLDSLPVYPKHVLEGPLEDGAFGAAWGTSTPPESMPALGPFIVESYTPGQRVTLARNPRFWRTGEDGRSLPHLDRIVLEIVLDQNAELLRLTSGEVDVLQSEVRPEDYRSVKAAAEAGRLRLMDAGVSYDRHVLWFNLGATPKGREFLNQDAFRRAISVAVDRRAFADSVYLGAAEPAPDPVSPSNRRWVVPDLPRPTYDPAAAGRLLDGLNLRDRDGDGIREDEAGQPVRFTILFQPGVTGAERGTRFIRDALARSGVGVDLVGMDFASIMARWNKGDYDAIYHFIITTDTDPAGNLDFWLSSGASHLWAPAQTDPPAWEARIDELMRRHVASVDLAERQRLFAEVQRIFVEHNPALFFTAPHVYVASSLRVAEVTPAIQRPQLLWNAETLMLQSPEP
jgi:peptide/nickel transport system substrate-binding protein